MKGVKTGGRRKGSRNKASAQKEATIAASGLTPLEFMLQAMRDTARDFMTRLEAAKFAAPYVHPRLAAIEHTGKDGTSLIPSVMVVPGVLGEAAWEKAAPSQQEALAAKEIEVAANPRALQ